MRRVFGKHRGQDLCLKGVRSVILPKEESGIPVKQELEEREGRAGGKGKGRRSAT